jgi:WD40 repeat protein
VREQEVKETRRLRRCRVERVLDAQAELFQQDTCATRRGNSYCSLSHCGYVYAVITCAEFVCSAGGDGLIKLWRAGTKRYVATLTGHRGSVLALVADSTSRTLYSGSTDGTVRTWDVRLSVCKRTLLAQSAVLSLALAPSVLVAGFANGR